jgi:hypothetical protein
MPVDKLRPIDAYDRDQIRVNVKNLSDHDVDVTILYIDSAFGMISFVPTKREYEEGDLHNRIGKDQTVSAKFPINDATIGLEDVIIIATLPAAGTPPQNFAFLAQPGLLRGADDENPALMTPLGQLLASAAFASGDRGGNAAPDIAKYAVHRLSWTVRKTRPGAP